MKIIIWGLGYVGTVSAACLAHLGHDVIGVEPNSTKVLALNEGRVALREPGLDALVREVVSEGKLKAVQTLDTINYTDAEISMICVGTPSAADGSPVLDYIRKVAQDIGIGLKCASSYHVVVLRSTVFPGTTRRVLLPILEKYSGLHTGRDFGLAYNPEFLREATAIDDFLKPPYNIIGELDPHSGDLLLPLYGNTEAPLYRVMIEEAEFLKIANNAFHATKISFANEIGRLSGRLGVDSRNIMRLVCADTKLNISTAYLKPGFAFGGSCLPKDLRSLTFHARGLGVDLPMLSNLISSNYIHIQEARLKVHELGAKRIALLGLSFKPGTDDLRESPMIQLVRDLWQDGLDVVVFDPDVCLSETMGSNRDYLERQLPQADRVLCRSIEEALSRSEALIISQKRKEFASVVNDSPDDMGILDLVGLDVSERVRKRKSYMGICW